MEAASGEVTCYAANTQAYENDELAKMLVQAGFQDPDFYPSLTGKPAELNEMIVLVISRNLR